MASIKVAVMGKGVVGKSSLTYRFINYNAPAEHEATIEDRYKTQIVIDDVNYEVEILDTAGEQVNTIIIIYKSYLGFSINARFLDQFRRRILTCFCY